MPRERIPRSPSCGACVPDPRAREGYPRSRAAAPRLRISRSSVGKDGARVRDVPGRALAKDVFPSARPRFPSGWRTRKPPRRIAAYRPAEGGGNRGRDHGGTRMAHADLPVAETSKKRRRRSMRGVPGVDSPGDRRSRESPSDSPRTRFLHEFLGRGRTHWAGAAVATGFPSDRETVGPCPSPGASPGSRPLRRRPRLQRGCPAPPRDRRDPALPR